MGGWMGGWTVPGKMNECRWKDGGMKDEWMRGSTHRWEWLVGWAISGWGGQRDGEMSWCLSCSLLVTLFQLRAAEVEIKDLQSEFELEKIDYLATIRRQERDFMLFQQLLEQVQPLVRRDCNYSNLEKIKRECCWDEDNGFWKIPEPVVIKTSLPVGQEPGCPLCPPCLPPQFAILQTDREPWPSPCWLWVQQTCDPKILKHWASERRVCSGVR